MSLTTKEQRSLVEATIQSITESQNQEVTEEEFVDETAAEEFDTEAFVVEFLEQALSDSGLNENATEEDMQQQILNIVEGVNFTAAVLNSYFYGD